MIAINWKRNEAIQIAGETYRVCKRLETGEINLHHVNDDRFVTLPEAELVEKWASGELVRLVDADGKLKQKHREMLEQPFVTMTAAVKDEATRRYRYLKAFVDTGLRHRSSKLLQPIIDEVAEQSGDQDPPSPRKMRRWLKAWSDVGAPELAGDIRSLAPRYHHRGNKWKRFDPEVEEILLEVIDAHWLIPERVSAPELMRLVNARLDKLDVQGREQRFLEHNGQLRRPSLRTVYRHLESLDRDLVAQGHNGYLQYEKTCLPVGLGPKASRPLQEVEIDHTVLDVFVLDPERNIALGRPYITVALCRHTRMIIGVYIGFEPPGAHSVMLCLRNAIRPKTWLSKLYPEIKSAWPCFGLPKTIVVDNGPEFHGRAFKEACLALGIDIVYCPARKPWYKGKVERFFGTLARNHLHTIPGTTFSNTKERGDYRPEKEAVMSLGDLKASILKWIVDFYSQSVHRALRKTPAMMWEEGVKRHPVSLPRRMEDLEVLLNDVVDRKLTRRGIEFEGLLFCKKSPEFRTLINRADKPDAVKVRVDRSDLSSVFVEDWVTGQFIEVPSVDPEYTDGLSLAEHSLLKQKAKQDLAPGERVRMRHLTSVRAEFHAQIAELKRLKKLKGKRLARILEETEMPFEEEKPRKAKKNQFDLETVADEDDEVEISAPRSRPRKASAPKTPSKTAKPKQAQAGTRPAVAMFEDEDDQFADGGMNLGIHAEIIN